MLARVVAALPRNHPAGLPDASSCGDVEQQAGVVEAELDRVGGHFDSAACDGRDWPVVAAPHTTYVRFVCSICI
eukprot:COSAG03_NODE_3408_length_2036_cov_11.853898_2_plen_74_part_00